MRDQAVADRQLDEDVGGFAHVHAMAEEADGDAAHDVDRRDDEARDGVAAHEFRGAVHGAEEGTLFLEFAPAQLRHLVVDDTSRQVRVDRHLLAGNGVEGEARADLGDACRALVMTMKFTMIRIRKTIRPIMKSPLITSCEKPEIT